MLYMAQFICSFFCCPKILYGLEKRAEDRQKNRDKKELTGRWKAIIEKKIEIRCKVCNQRLFDYLSGSFVIEIKCSRCGSINTLCRKNLNKEKGAALVLRHGTV